MLPLNPCTESVGRGSAEINMHAFCSLLIFITLTRNLKCSWWHPRQANDAIASEPSIFSENHDYKSFFRVAVNTYVPIFRGLDARGGRKLRTDTHTHTPASPRHRASAPPLLHPHTHPHRNYGMYAALVCET